MKTKSNSIFEGEVRFRIKLVREVRRMTIVEAAEAAGMSRAVWGKMEAGGREVTFTAIARCAKALGVEAFALTGSKTDFADLVKHLLLTNTCGHITPPTTETASSAVDLI